MLRTALWIYEMEQRPVVLANRTEQAGSSAKKAMQTCFSYLLLCQQININHFCLDWNQGQWFKSQAPSVFEIVLQQKDKGIVWF